MAGLTRKQLLAGAAAAGVVAGCRGSAKQPPALDPRDWASVKGQYPLAPGVRYFDAFVLAAHPRGARGDRAPPARARRRAERLPAPL